MNLLNRLAQVQTRRFSLALEQLGEWGLQSTTAFLNAMIDPQKHVNGSATWRQAAGRQGGAR